MSNKNRNAMKEVLKEHNKSLILVLAKVFEIEEQLTKISKEIEKKHLRYSKWRF